jgi:hypothetical protein
MKTDAAIEVAFCARREDSRAADLIARLIQSGIEPHYLLLVDPSTMNQANTAALVRSSRPDFPFTNEIWERGEDGRCCITLALERRIPFYCFADVSDPVPTDWVRRHPVDVLLDCGESGLRGEIGYVPNIGVLAVHPARLPEYRGAWAMAANLYANEPLSATAAFIAPRPDQRVIAARCALLVRRGDTVAQIMQRSNPAIAELLAQAIRSLRGEITLYRQQPWEGKLYGSEDTEPRDLNPLLDLVDSRLRRGAYAYFESEEGPIG